MTRPDFLKLLIGPIFFPVVQKNSAYQKWEYYVLDMTYTYGTTLQEILIIQGDLGWELVDIQTA